MYRLFHSLGGVPWSYDVTSNRLVQLQGLPTDIPPEDIEAYLLRRKLILPFQEGGEVVQRVGDADYLALLDGFCGRLTLELTEQCNLRCSYCVYSGKFLNRRIHSHQRMPMETSRSAVELFSRLSRRLSRISICFYGGEPLLNFEAIRELVPWARDKLSGRAAFHISSNGTLLDDAFFRWFSRNPDVFLDVTLNGPQHDRYRRYANGNPSMNDVLCGIERLRADYPDIAQTRLNLLCNVGDIREIEPLRLFYQNLGMTPSLITGLTFPEIDGGGRSLSDSDEAWEKLAWSYIHSEDSFLCRFFEPGLLRIHHRSAESVREQTPLVGTCLPLLSNLYVSAKGELTLCEKTTGPSLGNVAVGPDRDAIIELMHGYRNALRGCCRFCWAQRLCTVCYRDYDSAYGCVRQDACTSVLYNLHRELSLYASVCEEAPERLMRFDAMHPVLEGLPSDVLTEDM